MTVNLMSAIVPANSSANGSAPPAASTRRVALIVAAAFFMMVLDGAILNTSLPLMAKSLGVTPLALTAGITVYLLAAAAIIPASGWRADRWEARRVFAIAMAVFTLASLGCGLSQNMGQLVAARACQGVAALDWLACLAIGVLALCHLQRTPHPVVSLARCRYARFWSPRWAVARCS